MKALRETEVAVGLTLQEIGGEFHGLSQFHGPSTEVNGPSLIAVAS